MREVRLYGVLAKKFGRSFQFDVRTPREALAALKATVKGFKEHITRNSEPGYHIFVGKVDIDGEELELPIGQREVIKVVPATVGSGGFFKIIIGVALLFTPLNTLGISMILSGISEILFAPPKPNSAGQQEKPDNKPSYVFDGPVNTVVQGHPVPICYGKLRVGSQVISAGLYAENF